MFKQKSIFVLNFFFFSILFLVVTVLATSCMSFKLKERNKGIDRCPDWASNK